MSNPRACDYCFVWNFCRGTKVKGLEVVIISRVTCGGPNCHNPVFIGGRPWRVIFYTERSSCALEAEIGVWHLDSAVGAISPEI